MNNRTKWSLGLAGLALVVAAAVVGVRHPSKPLLTYRMNPFDINIEMVPKGQYEIPLKEEPTPIREMPAVFSQYSYEDDDTTPDEGIVVSPTYRPSLLSGKDIRDPEIWRNIPVQNYSNRDPLTPPFRLEEYTNNP